ncbi:MAG: hypothetical protein JWQ20_1778 [Conexibacter sp.]|nr:hypothetical protein [Conexibacter sp.]
MGPAHRYNPAVRSKERKALPVMSRLTPSLVLSVVALVLAGAGGATAASTLITGKQVKNSSLTGADIKNGSLAGDDIRNGSLAGDDLASASVGPAKLTDALLAQIAKAATPGPAGATGPAGPAGPAGATGPSALASLVIAQGDGSLCTGTGDCSVGSAYAACPAGTKPLGGGVSTQALNGTFVGSIASTDTTTGYLVAADNYGASYEADLTAFAYCSKDVQSITFPSGSVRMSVASVDQRVQALLKAHRSAR